MIKAYVFDTYAKTHSGRIMHFDVVIAENVPEKALKSAKDWLASLGEHDAELAPENCTYCHCSDDIPLPMQQAIAENGYAIFKLEGCPK
jgi:hypothetical protein